MGSASAAVTMGGLAGAPAVGRAAVGQGPRTVPPGLRPGGAFDEFVAALAAKDEFSGTVLLAHRGRTVLSRSYGMANRETSVPVTADTVFPIASTGKLFISLAIAQLAQRRKIAYHEKLGTYLHGFPPGIADTVTVHQLVTHTSGIGRPASGPGTGPEGIPGSDAWSSEREVFEKTLDFVRGLPLAFTPGTRHQYSNDAYFLLSAIVAAKSDEGSYFDHVREHIFRPAGMKRSDFCTKPQWRTDPRIARPYHRESAGAPRVDVLERQPYVDMAFTTTGDLLRFATAVHQGDRLLDPEFTWIALSPKLARGPMKSGEAASASGEEDTPAADDGAVSFATYSPAALLDNGQWVLGHAGGTPGVSANLSWYPGSDWVTATLSNYDHGTAGPIDRLSQSIIVGRAPGA